MFHFFFQSIYFLSDSYIQNGTLTNDMLLQLFSVFGQNLRNALDLIDKGAVNKIIGESTKEEFFQVRGSSDVTYIILPSSWRCSCPAWFQARTTLISPDCMHKFTVC